MLVEIAGVFFHFDSKKRFFSICPSGFLFIWQRNVYKYNKRKGKNREYIFVLYSESIVLYSAF